MQEWLSDTGRSRRAGTLKDILGRNAKKELREKIYHKIVKLGAGSTEEMSMAGLTQISMEGVEQLDLYYTSYIPQFFYAMLSPLILFCITVWIDWRVALVLLACVPLIPASIVAVSRYAKKIFEKYWGKYTSMGDGFLDSVQGLKELKIFMADEAQQKKMNNASEEFRRITMKVLVMQLASTTIMDLVAYGGAGAGIAFAVLKVAEGGLSPFLSLFLILVAVEFFLPLRAFGAAFHVAMNGVSAGNKILSFLAAADPIWGEEKVSHMEWKLEDVNFSYDGRRNVLKGVTMSFPQKGMTSIVGESGCGKSTVVQILLGGIRPKSGSVAVGGKKLEDLSRESYYTHLSAVSYNTYIFNETVRRNFKLADKRVSDEEIYAALEKVNLARFIRENGGLDKKIMEDGANLILLLGNLSFLMLLAVLNGSAGFLCAMGVPLLGAVGIAKALGESISLSYGWIAALAIGCGVLRGLLRYLEQYSNHYIAFRLLAVLRDKIFSALRILCPAKLESKQKGSIIAMITSDIETLEVFYAHTISPICIAVVVSGGVILFVGKVSGWWLAFVAAMGFLVVGIVIPIVASGRLKASGVRYREEFASFNAYFLDSIKGIRDIVLNRAGKEREKEVNRRSRILLDETKKMKQETVKAAAATELFVSLFIFAALAVGILLVETHRISMGKMVIGVAAVFGSFGPVIAISALPGSLTQTFASGDRVLNLLSEKPAVTPVENGRTFSFERLGVRDLCFSYDGQKQVLSEICMYAKKGEIIGIVGESGCGKSTFLKLLLRFWRKDSGELAYNGMDIEKIQTDSLLENVTMVSQVTYLFDETIEENLCIAKPDATREEMEQACRQASIHEWILSLPEGYQTKAGALGEHLSAGEKQRIGLARAFLRGSELILLDEPTSNVDSINEGIILKALKEQKHKKSIILVSHRESTMSIADRIYRVEDGRMYEQNRA